MKPIIASIEINAPRARIWKMITDLENAPNHIRAIKRIEILEKPANGLVGVKWRETRDMFGKEATETMWITGAREQEWYETEAHNSGCAYHTRIELRDGPNKAVTMSWSFHAIPETLIAKLFVPISWLLRGMLAKALMQDLNDLKGHLEGAATAP